MRLRQLTHLQALGRALELRHEVKARQRGVELALQQRPHSRLDQVGAGEQPQPQPQRIVVIVAGARLDVGPEALCAALRAIHQLTSPPATTMLCPVTLSLPGRHSHNTAFATSAGVIRRCCGLCATRAASASRVVAAGLLLDVGERLAGQVRVGEARAYGVHGDVARGHFEGQ